MAQRGLGWYAANVRFGGVKADMTFCGANVYFLTQSGHCIAHGSTIHTVTSSERA